MAFFDIQISAPKDVSVLAMVGGDERVRRAFRESVETILGEMERFAAVRERRGNARDTEAFRLTENLSARGSCTTPAAISILSFTFMP